MSRRHRRTRRLANFILIASTMAASLLAGVDPSRAQNVADSTKMEVKPFKYRYRSGPQNAYYNCGAGMYAIWRDIGQRIVNGPTRFSDYTLVATEGESVYSTGQTLSDSLLNIVVPEGYYGIYSGSTGTQAGGAYSSSCSYYESIYETWASGGVVPPNPFRVTEWWAIYNVPEGSVIAGFEWQQVRGLDVAFDGGFRLSREVEATGAKPVVAYEWDFGDGKAPSTSARPTHTYDEPGVYTVRLTVTDDDDQQDTETRRVTVRGVVLEYTATATGNVAVGDTMYVSLSVTNVGTVNAATVTIPRDYNFPPKYPESIITKSTDATRMALSSMADSVVMDLGPGATVNVGQSYKVPTGAIENDAGVRRDVPVRWKVSVIGLSGVDDSGFPAVVNNANVCERGTGCTDETLVEYKPMAVTAKATTLDAQDGTVSMFSGIRQAIDTEFYSHLVPPGFESALCNSGCVDLELEARSGGLPLEGAAIELTRFLRDTDANGTSDVTPGQGGGVFCVDNRCGTTLTLEPTDENGLAKARFWSPGVVWPVRATITAKARKAGYATAEFEREITINPSFAPSGSDVRTFNPSFGDMQALAIAEAVEVVTSADFKDLDDVCKTVAKLVSDQTIGRLYADRSRQELIKAGQKAKDYICGSGFKKYFIDREFESETTGQTRADAAKAAGFLRQFSTVLSVLWTFKFFDLPWSGVGEFSLSVKPPSLSYTSEMWEKVVATNRLLALEFGKTGVVPSQIDLYLHEVSHRTTTGKMVEALHLQVQSPQVNARHLITKNYRSYKFLPNDLPNTTTGPAANSGAGNITVSGGSGKTGAAADSIFSVGHVVVIDPDSESEEIAQITAITNNTLQLSVPLKYDHDAGAKVVFYDSLAVGPPGAPYRYGGLMGMPGESTTPEIQWFSFEPAVSYAVEVATDTLFQDVVQSYSDLTQTTLTLAQLDARGTYYWRVSATNLSGQGSWSDWIPLRTGAPWGDNLSEAHVVTDTLDETRYLLHFASTAEPSEADASCGDGQNSVWFKFTPATGRRVVFETFNSSHDTILSVWTGGGHPLTEVVCNDDHANPGGDMVPQSYVELDAIAGTTYYIRVSGHEDAEGVLQLTFRGPTLVGTEDPESPTPTRFGLSAYPNPVSGIATVVVDHPEPALLEVAVYDMLGRRRVQLATGEFAAGTHTFSFDASRLATGVYMVMASAPTSRVVRPLTIVR